MSNNVKYDLPINYNNLHWTERKKVREQYVKEQNYKCFYCQQDLKADAPEDVRNLEINWQLFPPNFLKHPIHLQHNHDTGMTEGAVHGYCNAVLWQYFGR
tara:strand:- start:1139 stop:1438 length:300 start_codon:yes stop_codon:yes gene_type:complete